MRRRSTHRLASSHRRRKGCLTKSHLINIAELLVKLVPQRCEPRLAVILHIYRRRMLLELQMI